MWKGTGRSGIGDQTIIGEYDDWSGLSMNGRQWKNPTTLETRDLSGADYWHQRKAIEPKTTQDIPTYVNGKPNIAAFAEPIAKSKAPAKTKSVLNSILLADRNYERLCGLSEQLDVELDQGQIDLESWAAARRNIDKRLEKAWDRVCKERPELLEPEQYPGQGLDFTLDFTRSSQRQLDYSVIPRGSVFAELQDGNIFKQCAVFLLTACKWFANVTTTAKQLVQEGLV